MVNELSEEAMNAVWTTYIEAYPVPARRHWAQVLLLGNGLVLGATGLAQASFDLAGYFLNLGPLAAALHGNPDALAYFEAHALAMLAAVLLIANHRTAGAGWNWAAAAIHLLLGGANLLFWPTFVAYDLVPMGIVATSGHALFLGLELVAAGARSAPDKRRR
ncbi:hypothetical protein ASC89_01815 [Devosia sp. Root413D1]|uniref:hypothetical protein n=1 Tax=Devosia sp. Root413D1 TaxID=1736531 RepID=UPI0006F4FDD4|nr:hypothetical protein [Devosia sp. Root413D1]KQW85833.1 hypothetical protein ASC89_01815 [Devosia sp. Root413D1]